MKNLLALQSVVAFDRSCRDLQTSVGLNNQTWHLSSKSINYWEPANSTTNFEKSPYHWDYQRIGSTPGISPISVPTRFMTPWYPRPLVHPDTKTSERPCPLTFIENRRYESTLRIRIATPKRSETHLHHNFNVGNPIKEPIITLSCGDGLLPAHMSLHQIQHLFEGITTAEGMRTYEDQPTRDDYGFFNTQIGRSRETGDLAFAKWPQQVGFSVTWDPINMGTKGHKIVFHGSR